MNGNAANRLFERMRKTHNGWTQLDFERLLTGFGFTYREGKKHRIYAHSEFGDLRISVPRHNVLKEWVAREAVALIEALEERRKQEGATDETSHKET